MEYLGLGLRGCRQSVRWDGLHGATKVILTGKSGVLASGIESIKFTASHVAGSVDNAFVWRELDVFGGPSS